MRVVGVKVVRFDNHERHKLVAVGGCGGGGSKEIAAVGSRRSNISLYSRRSFSRG